MNKLLYAYKCISFMRVFFFHLYRTKIDQQTHGILCIYNQKPWINIIKLERFERTKMNSSRTMTNFRDKKKTNDEFEIDNLLERRYRCRKKTTTINISQIAVKYVKHFRVWICACVECVKCVLFCFGHKTTNYIATNKSSYFRLSVQFLRTDIPPIVG